MNTLLSKTLTGALFLLVLTALSLYGIPVDAAKRLTNKKSRALIRDRSALLSLKKSISDNGRSSVAAWKARGNPCFPKPWPHITCASERVSTVDLSNLDIVGTLPARLKVLNRVTELNLENNRFTGEIPSGWAHRTKLRNLKTINLGNNMLTGHLPNRKWNNKNAFRSLEILDLSQNMLSGGLPDGWLSTANTFRRLKLLDLSDNQLGLNSDGSAMEPYTGIPDYGWCLQGRTDDSGWCPATVSKARATSLEVLDLSENSLAGKLPDQWAQMFPNLQSLLLHRNSFYPDTDAPGTLPNAWTRRTVPRAFPQLEALVLYPGNALICSVPDLDTNSFSDINGALSYLVEDDAGMEFDSENPWFCPGPSSDNPPTKVAVTVVGDTLKLSWAAPDGKDMVPLVYAYRFTLAKYNFDQEEYVMVPGWTARTFKVHGGNSEGLEGDDSGYTLDTGIVFKDLYQLRITTINMNGVESSAATATSPVPQDLLPQCPASGDDYTCGSSPGQCSCASGSECDSSIGKCLCPASGDDYTCGSSPGQCSCASGSECDSSIGKCLDQAQLLLSFKSSFAPGSVSKEPLSTWSDGTDVCSWTGVECNSANPKEVTKINLSSKFLVGSLPDLEALPVTLQHLDLSYNQFSGAIPASWRIPRGLQFLLVNNNVLTGSIPQDFAANLPSSTWSINLSNNDLTGSIPAISGHRTDFYFILHTNQLSGSLPTISSPEKTAKMMIKPGNCGLTGNIPTGVITWTKSGVTPALTSLDDPDCTSS